jgi:hypothetical protein
MTFLEDKEGCEICKTQYSASHCGIIPEIKLKRDNFFSDEFCYLKIGIKLPRIQEMLAKMQHHLPRFCPTPKLLLGPSYTARLFLAYSVGIALIIGVITASSVTFLFLPEPVPA